MRAFRRCVPRYQGERYVKAVPLSRPVSHDGVHPTDQPREPARHRGLSSRPTEQAAFYTILQILSLILFEKISLIQLLAEGNHTVEEGGMSNQLGLLGN